MSEHYRGNEFIELIERVTGAKSIEGKNGWTIKCPAHSDGSPSLSVRENDAGTKLLVNCYAGCSITEICNSLDIRVSQLFFEKSNVSYKKKSKYERERLQIDKTVGWLFRERRKNNQPVEGSEREDFAAAEKRLRDYVAASNPQKTRK